MKQKISKREAMELLEDVDGFGIEIVDEGLTAEHLEDLGYIDVESSDTE